MGDNAKLCRLTAAQLLDKLQKGDVSPKEATRAALDQIHATDNLTHSYLYVNDDQAMARAAELESADRSLPLYGVPVTVKDNMCTADMPTTCASKILEGWRPPYDATIVSRLRAAGAVLIGKTNMDEFAMGSSCENSGFHNTHNPWDLERVPGGSSGGSAAAMAADQGFIALGSDTGGSIRQPASFCGITGLKPTYGAVSRYGLVAFASSLDQIGPLTKDVTDAALMCNVICGHDPMDSTSIKHDYPADYTAFLNTDIKGMKIGVVEELMGEGISQGVKDKVSDAIKVLESNGAEIVGVSLPNVPYCIPAYYLIAPAEASSNLARYDGVRYGLRAEGVDDIIAMYCKTRRQGFGDEVKRRIMLGTYALSAGYYDAYYLRALKVRTLVVRDFNRAFAQCDVLVSPATPSTPFKIGELVDDPIAMYLNDLCTVSVNLAGLPGMSIPCGTFEGLPVGLQFIGKPFAEPELLHAAYAYEQAAGRLQLNFGA
jgi:aspartyl-tRNA(Asn)/glutamyl-tRNA(Gln) amidotransferase subunit A